MDFVGNATQGRKGSKNFDGTGFCLLVCFGFICFAQPECLLKIYEVFRTWDQEKKLWLIRGGKCILIDFHESSYLLFRTQHEYFQEFPWGALKEFSQCLPRNSFGCFLGMAWCSLEIFHLLSRNYPCSLLTFLGSSVVLQEFPGVFGELGCLKQFQEFLELLYCMQNIPVDSWSLVDFFRIFQEFGGR